MQISKSTNDSAMLPALFVLIMCMYSMFGMRFSYLDPVVPGGWALPGFFASIVAPGNISRMDEITLSSTIVLTLVYGFFAYQLYRQKIWASMAIMALYLGDTYFLILGRDWKGAGIHFLFFFCMVYGLVRILHYHEKIALEPKAAVPEKRTGLARPFSVTDQSFFFSRTFGALIFFTLLNLKNYDPAVMALPGILGLSLGESLKFDSYRIFVWLMVGMLLLFAIFTYNAQKGKVWAFWAGTGLYTIDTGFAIWSGEEFAIFVHILFLLVMGWLIFKRFQAQRLSDSGYVIPDVPAFEDLSPLRQAFILVYQARYSKTKRMPSASERFAALGGLFIVIGLLGFAPLARPTGELGFLNPALPFYVARLISSPDSTTFETVNNVALLFYILLMIYLGVQTKSLHYWAFVVAVILLGIDVFLLFVSSRLDLVWVRFLLLGFITIGFKNYADMKKQPQEESSHG